MTREEKVELIGEYFRNTGASTRKIAKYFSEHGFPISNRTVSVYIHEYMKTNAQYQEEIEAKINENTEKDIDTPERQKQILIEFELLMKGYKIEEIADILEIGYSSVERDLTTRLEHLSKKDKDFEQIYLLVKEQLRKNQMTWARENRKK